MSIAPVWSGDKYGLCLGLWGVCGQEAQTVKALAASSSARHGGAMKHSLRAAILSLTLTFGLLGLSGCARAEYPDTSANPALWVVRDADTTIYLFGTVHVLKPDMVWFDDEVKAAFDRSDELKMEMVDAPPEEMQALIGKLALNLDGPPLSSLLKGKDKERYLAAIKDQGQNLAAIDRLDPWMAAIQLSLEPLFRMGYSPEAGAEEVLRQAAQRKAMIISGLETPAQQFGLFDGLPQETQMAYLADTLKELPKVRTSFPRLIQSWAKGDTSAIAKEMNGSVEGTPELAEVLIYRRNANWARWVAQRMTQPGTVFMAVGAGHLAGKSSVLDDLAKAGYPSHRVSKADFGLE
jgi:uncharacterized protein